MFKSGYKPIVKPNKERFEGYYRHKARKLYMNPIGKQRCKQRGRGESIFVSLTNQFDDILKTKLYRTMVVRIGSRVLCYMIRIYMR